MSTPLLKLIPELSGNSASQCFALSAQPLTCHRMSGPPPPSTAPVQHDVDTSGRNAAAGGASTPVQVGCQFLPQIVQLQPQTLQTSEFVYKMHPWTHAQPGRAGTLVGLDSSALQGPNSNVTLLLPVEICHCHTGIAAEPRSAAGTADGHPAAAAAAAGSRRGPRPRHPEPACGGAAGADTPGTAVCSAAAAGWAAAAAGAAAAAAAGAAAAAAPPHGPAVPSTAGHPPTGTWGHVCHASAADDILHAKFLCPLARKNAAAGLEHL